ncbi:MAG: hypothetical protein R3A13_08200, partial [Bdellovibrionota bacterium]
EGEKPITYWYPELDQLKTENAAAYRLILEIKALIEAGKHSEAKRRVDKNRYVFAGVLRTKISKETEIDTIPEEFAFQNEYGIYEAWQFHSDLMTPEKENELILLKWKLRSYLEFDMFEDARKHLKKPLIGQSPNLPDEDKKRFATQIGFDIPNEFVIKLGDGNCLTFSFDGPSFNWRAIDRDKIHNVEQLLKSAEGEEPAQKKMKAILENLKTIMSAVRNDDPINAWGAVRGMQKMYRHGADGQWLVRVSELISEEEGDRILDRQQKDAKIKREGVKPKAGTDEVLELIFPISQDAERVVKIDFKEIPETEEGELFKKNLTAQVIKMKGLNPQHELSNLKMAWQDLEELVRGCDSKRVVAGKTAKLDWDAIERPIGANNFLNHDKRQALFDEYELNRLTHGILPIIKDQEFLVHIKELRRFLFERKEREELTQSNFSTSHTELWNKFQANAESWSKNNETEVKFIQSIYQKLQAYKPIDSFDWESQAISKKVKKEFEIGAKHQPERMAAFKGVYQKLAAAFGTSFQTVGYNKILSRVTYTHKQGFVLEFKAGSKRSQIKLGDRLSGVSEILSNAEIVLNLLDDPKSRLVKLKHKAIEKRIKAKYEEKLAVIPKEERTKQRKQELKEEARREISSISGKVEFEPESLLGRWIDGYHLRFSIDKGSFELKVPREDPSYEEIAKFPDDKYLLTKVRDAASHFMTSIRYGENMSDFYFSKRQIELIQKDLRVLLQDGQVQKSAKNKKAVKDMIDLCDYMKKMHALRREARKTRMVHQINVPTAADRFTDSKEKEHANDSSPVSNLSAESAMADLEATFGTKDNPKYTQHYMMYVKYVDDRGPRVICKPLRRKAFGIMPNPSFGIHIGQPGSGIDKWLRYADLAYDALQKDDAFVRKRSIWLRKLNQITKFEDPKKTFSKGWERFKNDFNEGRLRAFLIPVVGFLKYTSRLLGMIVVKDQVDIFKKNLEDRPFSLLLTTLIRAPFSIPYQAFKYTTHQLPVRLLEIADGLSFPVTSLFHKAEFNAGSDIWAVISNGDNGMGMIQADNIVFNKINIHGAETFIKTDMSNCKFIDCRLCGTQWMWAKLHNVSFKMNGGLAGIVESIPFLNKVLWQPNKPDHRIQARGMDMTGIRVTGLFSSFNRADLRDTNFTYSQRVGFRMRGAWLDGIKTDGMTRWGYMFPPGYETLRRIPIVGQHILLPICRFFAFAWYLEGATRGDNDKWQGVGNPEGAMKSYWGQTQWGSEWSMIDYQSIVEAIKTAAPFLRSRRVRVPTFLQQYAAFAKDYVIIDNEGCSVKFLVTWDGATNRVLAYIDTPEFWEEASKRIKAPRYLNLQLTVANGKKTYRDLEKMFAHIATVNRENPVGDANDMPVLTREFYEKDPGLDTETKYRMSKAREAAALRDAGGTSINYNS